MTVDRAELVLAGSSPVRSGLLVQAGYAADRVIGVEIDRSPLRDESASRRVVRLARAGVELVHARVSVECGQCYVLAADTEVVFGGGYFGSPVDGEQAEAMLHRLSGRAHRVVTAVSAMGPDGRRSTRLARARVRFKRLSRIEIADHIAEGCWRNMAGGYDISGSAGRFVIAVSGSYSAIMGLPLYETCCILEGLGYRRQQQSGKAG